MGLLAEYIKKEIDKGTEVSKIKKNLLEIGTDTKVVEHEMEKLGIREEREIHRYLKKFFVKKKSFLLYSAIVIGLLVIIIFKKSPCAGVEEKDTCYARLAMENSDIRYCKKIVDEEVKGICNLKLWDTNSCVYMERANFPQEEIDDCRRVAFTRSLG